MCVCAQLCFWWIVTYYCYSNLDWKKDNGSLFRFSTLCVSLSWQCYTVFIQMQRFSLKGLAVLFKCKVLECLFGPSYDTATVAEHIILTYHSLYVVFLLDLNPRLWFLYQLYQDSEHIILFLFVIFFYFMISLWTVPVVEHIIIFTWCSKIMIFSQKVRFS